MHGHTLAQAHTNAHTCTDTHSLTADASLSLAGSAMVLETNTVPAHAGDPESHRQRPCLLCFLVRSEGKVFCEDRREGETKGHGEAHSVPSLWPRFSPWRPILPMATRRSIRGGPVLPSTEPSECALVHRDREPPPGLSTRRGLPTRQWFPAPPHGAQGFTGFHLRRQWGRRESVYM